MNKSMLLIINPKSGKGSFRSGLGDVMETFCLNGYIPTVHFTKAPGDAGLIVAEHSLDYDIVVCVGGDGTLSEVASGMMTLIDPPPLGYIPMGTANDVATTLALPKNPEKAAQAIVNGSPMPIDIGRFGDSEYFTYISAFGAFTDVSYETPQENKYALGHLAYVFEGVTRFPKITPHWARIEYDDGVIEDEFIFGGVTNSTSIAGLVKLNDTLVSLADGLFELVLVRNPKSLLDMNKIVGGIVWQNYEGGQVTVLHSKKVRFILDEPVSWTRDGENGGVHQDISFVNCPSALRIIV